MTVQASFTGIDYPGEAVHSAHLASAATLACSDSAFQGQASACSVRYYAASTPLSTAAAVGN